MTNYNDLTQEQKDPLDEIFVDYHPQIIITNFGKIEFKPIDEKFILWLNSWADEEKHSKYYVGENKKEFIRGYEKALSDFYEALKIEWFRKDKRTKIGFKKN